jgi:hypothetical protein
MNAPAAWHQRLCSKRRSGLNNGLKRILNLHSHVLPVIFHETARTPSSSRQVAARNS